MNDVSMIILLVAMVGFMVVPSMLNRRKQKKREEELQPGDQIMTIGGFLGELTYINFEENLARVKFAEGVEIEMITGAISGKRADENVEESDDEEDSGVEEM